MSIDRISMSREILGDNQDLLCLLIRQYCDRRTDTDSLLQQPVWYLQIAERGLADLGYFGLIFYISRPDLCHYMDSNRPIHSTIESRKYSPSGLYTENTYKEKLVTYESHVLSMADWLRGLCLNIWHSGVKRLDYEYLLRSMVYVSWIKLTYIHTEHMWS